MVKTNSRCTGFNFLVLILSAQAPQYCLADNAEHHNGIDKIYHPYVQPLEREFEYRSIYQTDGDPNEDDILRQRLGFGRSVSERVFVEGYLIGIKPPGGSFRLEALELESKIQLTEQGEYWADWGVMFELSRERSEAITEVATIVLMEKEFGTWSGTMNIGTEYEFGSDIENEIDFEFAAQLRYRFSERLEPTIELYKDEFTFAIGPVLQGLERASTNRKLHWELGVLFQLNDTTPNSTYRLQLEYEF